MDRRARVGTTLAPLAGAAIGLGAAVLLCWLLYRRAVRLNVGLFFNRTAIALIVIAAGVLSYGLGDLQDAGLLPGQRWIAFDLTAHVDPNSWWVSVVTGVTELSPRMTVLQVVAWVVYLAVVIPRSSRPGRAAAAGKPPAGTSPSTSHRPPPAPAAAPPATATPPPTASRRPRRAGALGTTAARRPWAVAGVLVVGASGRGGPDDRGASAASTSASTAVTVTSTGCAREWSAARTGAQTFTVHNKSARRARSPWSTPRRRGGRDRDPRPRHHRTDDRDARSRLVHVHLPDVRQAVTTSATVQVTGKTAQDTPAAVRPGDPWPT